MRAAPYYPGQKMSTTYVMSGDDASLHFDVNNLTPKQKEDDESNKDLTGFLQMVLIGLGKPADHVMMYDAFGVEPWPSRVEAFASFFRKMGIDPIPAEHRHLHPKVGFYDRIAAALPSTDSITLYMTSGTNSVLHNDPKAYEVSRNVNSKFHFAANAPGFGIPVPETLVTTKGGLDSAEVLAFMDKYGHTVMLKTLGLAGARNVTSVSSLDQAKAYVAEYDDSMAVLLQEKLDFSKWTEMTADMIVTDKDIRITNFRKIMFADGIWVGNLIGPDVDVEVTELHRRKLIKIGEYARAQGHWAPEGLNCGVDYFIGDKDGFIVTEINCRWTGGLFPTEMIRKVGAEHETCVAFIGLVRHDKFDDYLKFVEKHLYKNSDRPFGVIPLGFSPIPQDLPGGEHYFTWQVVPGDFEAFKKARREELGNGALAQADSISLAM